MTDETDKYGMQMAGMTITPGLLSQFNDRQLSQEWEMHNEWSKDATRMQKSAKAYSTPGEMIFDELQRRGIRINLRLPLVPKDFRVEGTEEELAKSGLPMAAAGTSWDAGAARAALKKWATKGDGTIDVAKYGRAFLFHGTPANLLGSYKFPIATIINGKLTAVPNAIRAAKGRLAGSSIPAAAKARIASILSGYSSRLGWNDLHKSDVKPLHPVIKDDQPLVAFVSGSPDFDEAMRNEPIVGVAGNIFAKRYLEPLGLAKSDVAILHQVPVLLKGFDGGARGPTPQEVLEWKEWVADELDTLAPDITIALGHGVGEAVPADFTLPHPKVLMKSGSQMRDAYTTDELNRKLGVIKEYLDERREAAVSEVLTPEEPNNGNQGEQYMRKSALDNNEHQFSLFTADEPDKRNLIFGVVYKPDTLDSQKQWVPPEVLEDAAQWFMKHSQLTDTEHQELAGARIVESYIAKTDENIYGRDVPKGSWAVTTEVSDDLKKDIDNGLYNDYSMFGKSMALYGAVPPGYEPASDEERMAIAKLEKVRPVTLGFVNDGAAKEPFIIVKCSGADCPLENA
jgi:hypothetical protein